MRYELKRVDGKTVEWDGTDGENAARRYVDAMRVAGKDDGGGIVASRRPRADCSGIHVLGRHATFTETLSDYQRQEIRDAGRGHLL